MTFQGTVYDEVTGRIFSHITTSLKETLDLQQIPAGFLLIKVGPKFNQYIDVATELPIDKDAMSANWDKTSIIADGSDTAVLTGLPLNVTVFIDDAPFVVADGILNFTATSPGEYRFMVDEVKYLKKEWIVNAT